MVDGRPGRNGRLSGIRFGDLLAGISVALVAIPQSLAYAELAGMPAYTGLYAVALPSLAAAFFVSSPYLQTGPVALTSLLVFGTLSQLAVPGSSEYLGLAALLALVVGSIRIFIGFFRFGAVAYLLSQPVLMGFTSAAAILILASQLPAVLGVAPGGGGVMISALRALARPDLWNPSAVGLAIMTVAVVLLGRRFHPLFPGVLLAAGLGIVYQLLIGYDGVVVGDIPAGLPRLNLVLPWGDFPSLLIGGLIIALVGFADTASISRTYATQDRAKWDANREFISQGVSNVAAGMFSAFPVGGSFARSSVNRMAGAKTRWSGAVTGLVILAFLPFTGVLSALPKAILAAIVVSAVLNLIKLRELVKLRQLSRPQAYIGWVTFVLTLILAPRIDVAVIIGVGLAIAQHLRREQQLVLEHRLEGTTLHFRPLGVLWFASAAKLEEAFTDLLVSYPEVQTVHFHLGGLGRIDLSAAMTLRRLMEDIESAGLDFELLEVPPMAKSWVRRVWRDVLERNVGGV